MLPAPAPGARGARAPSSSEPHIPHPVPAAPHVCGCARGTASCAHVASPAAADATVQGHDGLAPARQWLGSTPKFPSELARAVSQTRAVWPCSPHLWHRSWFRSHRPCVKRAARSGGRGTSETAHARQIEGEEGEGEEAREGERGRVVPCFTEREGERERERESESERARQRQRQRQHAIARAHTRTNACPCACVRSLSLSLPLSLSVRLSLSLSLSLALSHTRSTTQTHRRSCRLQDGSRPSDCIKCV